MKLRNQWLFLEALLTKRVPVYVQYAVTRKCNLHCRICNSNLSRSQETDLTLPKIRRLALILKNMKVATVVLTGGEPFLRDDIIEILNLFKDAGLEVRFQTNVFLLTPGLAARLNRAGTNGITLSLDSLDSEIQDRMTDSRNSHERIFKALSLISQVFGPTRKICAINTVVSRLNLEELPALARFATALGVFISFIPLHSDRSVPIL